MQGYVGCFMCELTCMCVHVYLCMCLYISLFAYTQVCTCVYILVYVCIDMDVKTPLIMNEKLRASQQLVRVV